MPTRLARHNNDVPLKFKIYISNLVPGFVLFVTCKSNRLLFLLFPITNMNIVLVAVESVQVATTVHFCPYLLQEPPLGLSGRLAIVLDRTVDGVNRHCYHQRAMPMKRGEMTRNPS